MVIYINHNARTTQFERPGAADGQHDVHTLPSAPTAEELAPWTDQESSTASAQLAASEEPLPPNWAKKTTKQGRDFFINHVARITTWVDPRTGQESPLPPSTDATNAGSLDRQVSTQHPDDQLLIHILTFSPQVSSNSLGPLPDGWEEKHLSNGKMFFVDHNNKRTTWEDPRFFNPNIAGKEVEYSRDYKYKYEMFMRQMKEKGGTERDKFEFSVRRNHIVDDSYNAIGKLKHPLTTKMRHRLWITFAGEQGLDYGGLARLVYNTLFQKPILLQGMVQPSDD